MFAPVKPVSCHFLSHNSPTHLLLICTSFAKESGPRVIEQRSFRNSEAACNSKTAAVFTAEATTATYEETDIEQ